MSAASASLRSVISVVLLITLLRLNAVFHAVICGRVAVPHLPLSSQQQIAQPRSQLSLELEALLAEGRVPKG